MRTVVGRHATTARQTPGGWRLLAAFASSVLLTAVVLVALAMVVAPAVLRAMPFTVLTGSMRPTMPPGTLVVSRPTPATDVRIGDVVTYQVRSGEPAVVTHRVVGTGWAANGDLVLVTKGDANAVTDAPVRAAQIRGVVAYHVPYLGYVNTWVGHNRPHWAAKVAAAGLFAYALWMLVGAARDRKSRATATDDETTMGPVSA
ncbi:signal peptidase I [Cellulomonas sp. URHD0024]|uniref:signal peptidase I n=1 Tax=Cellulomonas sp. URHD0024 TaxID=1302620 RepID=UPI000484A34E|nr:signal peptidase I [Cellulomonas sp. URHD0024]